MTRPRYDSSTSSRSDEASCSPSRKNGQAARDIIGRKRAPRGSLAKGMFEKTRDQFDLVRVAAHGNAIATGDHMGANQVLECTKDAVAGAQNARGINSLGNE